TDVLDGCEGPAENVKIFINELPNAGFVATHNSLTLDFAPTVSGLTTYNWDFGNGNTSLDQGPSHTFQSEGTYTVSLSVIDNNGCENDTSQVIAVIATNVNMVFNSQNIKIHPNPANNFITIDFNKTVGKSNLIMVDLLGRKVIEKEINNTQKETINIENLPNGIYNIRITDSNQNIHNYKIIKN
ncbi:MAG: T9SS type A sorting domain-containing protein, partial [Bacteroidetes bacterium]|nr:T9SS type A sorting domain-containing protein [Bacteroidota bacterium]